jgi:hypothetical protein
MSERDSWDLRNEAARRNEMKNGDDFEKNDGPVHSPPKRYALSTGAMKAEACERCG